jgi:hypothetical protein
MLDASCFQRGFCRAQQFLAQIAVVVGPGAMSSLRGTYNVIQDFIHVAIDYNDGYVYIGP